MSKRQIIMLLGVLVIFLPFLGFTSLWDKGLSVVFGIIIIIIAYQMTPIVKINDSKKESSNLNDIDTSKDAETVSSSNSFPFVEHQSNVGATTTK